MPAITPLLPTPLPRAADRTPHRPTTPTARPATARAPRPPTRLTERRPPAHRPGASRRRPAAEPPWRTVDTVALLRRLARAPRVAAGLTLWLVLLGDRDAPTGLVVPVPDLPSVPDPWVVQGVLHAVGARSRGDGPAVRVAVGYVRPDGGTRGATEVAWSHALHRAADDLRVKIVTEVAVGRRRTSLLSVHRSLPHAA
jgi:hypothetical protein